MCNKVMVVDDDQAVLYTVEAILKSEGFDVHPVSSGSDCLSRLSEGFRGLILMDIMMPEMDGWDTIREVVNRDLMEGNVICVLTAVGDPGPKMEHLKEYVMDFVRKPFEMKELLDSVNDALTCLN